jgi:hypothetical protein
MSSITEEYMKGGEIIYTGMIDSALAVPGNNRAIFSWELSSDPRVTKTVIYWNEGVDSSLVAISASQIGKKVEKELQLTEAYYLFNIITKDDEGHRSNGVNISADVYGDQYIAGLRNRSIQTSTMGTTGLTVNWFAIETTDIQYVTVVYTDFSDPGNPVAKTVQVENTDTSTLLPGAKLGESFTVVTVYLPKGGLDMVSVPAKGYTIQ